MYNYYTLFCVYIYIYIYIYIYNTSFVVLYIHKIIKNSINVIAFYDYVMLSYNVIIK